MFSRLSSNPCVISGSYPGHHLSRLFSCWSFSSVLCCVFLESLEPLAAFFKICSFFCAIECFDFRFHFFLTKVWTLCFLLADSAGKGLVARGYLSVCRDLFPAILLLWLFFVMVRVSSARGRVSSARILLLFFSHLGTSDLLTPCCFATVLYLLVDDFNESKRSSVFFMKSTV